MPHTARPFRSLLLGGTGLILIWTSLASAAQTPRQQWHQDIESGYQTLATSAAGLSQATERYCESPDTTELKRVRHQWQMTFLAWQAIRFVDFGPIERDSRAWQIQFWPDTRNLVAHKAQGWLGSDTDITQTTIAAGGVALQGLPALEYVLFDDQLQASARALPADRTCALLTAISAHLATTSAGIVSDWQALAPTYTADAHYTTDTFNAARTMLDLLQDKRLETPMGVRGGQRPNPYLADAWRSGQSLAALKASLSGLQRYFLPGLADLMSNAGQADLLRKLQQQLTMTLTAFGPLPDGLKSALSTDEGSQALQALLVQVSELRTLLAGPVADHLGIVRGFNSSDGD